MAQAEASSPAERGWVDRIQGAGKRLAATVERMLKLIRTERVRQHARPGKTPNSSRCSVRSSPSCSPSSRRASSSVDLDLAPDLGSAEVDPVEARRHPDEPARQRDQVHPRRRDDPGGRRPARGRTGSGSRSPTRASASPRPIGRTCSSRSSPASTPCTTPRASTSSASAGSASASAWSRRSSSSTAARSRSPASPPGARRSTFTLPRHPTPVKPDHSLAG